MGQEIRSWYLYLKGFLKQRQQQKLSKSFLKEVSEPTSLLKDTNTTAEYVAVLNAGR